MENVKKLLLCFSFKKALGMVNEHDVHGKIYYC